MAKTKISEFSSTPANNTDIDSINIAEGCAPSNINDAIRELMAQLKDFQTGAVGDSFNGPIGSSTASTGAFTNITASGTLGVTGVATLGAGAILNTPASVTLTNATGLPISTGVSGLGTGVATALAVNVGSAGAPVVNGGALGTPSSGTVTNLTGTASININGTVGATTPTTGAFTTLTTSSTVTLNGGTANGVTYLNGSKVLTSGSALTFDGSNLSLATNGSSFQWTNAGNNVAINGVSGQVDFYTGTSAYNKRYSIAADGTAIWTIGSEQMRLTSTGLGIGTSSPASKLDVNGAISASGIQAVKNTAFGYGGYSAIQIGNSGSASGNVALAVDISTVAGGGFNGQNQVVLPSNGALFVNAAGTNFIGAIARDSSNRILLGPSLASGVTGGNVVIDSSGNLGLGTAPSAWSSASRPALQLTNGAALFSRSGSTFLGQNFFYNSSDTGTYIADGYATIYNQASGQHQWFNAPSGTAGNTAPLTQAMTLEASGNLGVGTSSPSTKLEVVAPAGDNIVSTFRSGDSTAANNAGGGFRSISSATATSRIAQMWLDADGANLSGGDYFYIQKNGNSGNVDLVQYSNSAMTFSTNGTERARIDSSGNLLVGTTSQVNSTSRIASHVAAGNISLETNSTSTANYYPAIFYNNTSTAGYIQVIGTATTYNSISDYRLKTVIGSVSGAGTRIDALEPIEYEWKSNGERTRGFLAHKFQEVYPQSVSGEKDAVDADGKPVYQAMQASTSEVIADLVAEIQSLRKRVAQLETN